MSVSRLLTVVMLPYLCLYLFLVYSLPSGCLLPFYMRHGSSYLPQDLHIVSTYCLSTQQLNRVIIPKSSKSNEVIKALKIYTFLLQSVTWVKMTQCTALAAWSNGEMFNKILPRTSRNENHKKREMLGSEITLIMLS